MTGLWLAVLTIPDNLSGTVMPSMQHQLKTINLNGLKYEQNIKFTKATRSESMVRVYKDKKTKAGNEENIRG